MRWRACNRAAFLTLRKRDTIVGDLSTLNDDEDEGARDGATRTHAPFLDRRDGRGSAPAVRRRTARQSENGRGVLRGARTRREDQGTGRPEHADAPRAAEHAVEGRLQSVALE